MNAFWIFLLFVILQRIAELILARRNEKILRAKGAVEFDKNGYKVIVAMHVAFFTSLVSEKIFLEKELNRWWIIFGVLFIGAQVLRYWAIGSLGVYWNTKILVAPNHKLITRGPYKYIRHPNYIAVITEIMVIPLIFSCYLTAAVFSLINLILLRRRIKVEEGALGKASASLLC
jgi:methyltransferase